MLVPLDWLVLLIRRLSVECEIKMLPSSYSTRNKTLLVNVWKCCPGKAHLTLHRLVNLLFWSDNAEAFVSLKHDSTVDPGNPAREHSNLQTPE